MSILRSLTLAAGIALLSVAPATAAVHLPTVQRTLSAASASCQGASTATTTYTAKVGGNVVMTQPVVIERGETAQLGSVCNG